MTRNTLLDELVRGVTETVVRLGSVKDDVEKQVRATLSASLERLDVVTRDEMEVQRALVSRLRERVELLEQRVNAMDGGGQPDLAGATGFTSTGQTDTASSAGFSGTPAAPITPATPASTVAGTSMGASASYKPDPDDAEQAGLATGRKPERPNTAASGQWANDEPGAD